MALGAFLAGMIVGQTDFSARAASDALPMKDAFAVLFFVSVGMMFDPFTVWNQWPLLLVTVAVILIGKPLAALVVVLWLGWSVRSAAVIAVALAQIGEFSFILSALGLSLGIVPSEATSVLVGASMVSITLNPVLFRLIDPTLAWCEARGWLQPVKPDPEQHVPEVNMAPDGVIVVGYGPTGRLITRLLQNHGIKVCVVETNPRTAQSIKAQGLESVQGDASRREILLQAGAPTASGLIISAKTTQAPEVVRVGRELNPRMRIITTATYINETEALRAAGADEVLTAEGEIALVMASRILQELGFDGSRMEREISKARLAILGSVTDGKTTPAPRPLE
ncbi:MAG: cation:proton antiporter [Verrucomicrobiae bacterium]|nr:cation:proton antiporter [Verrucomicrobiae bacterium]